MEDFFKYLATSEEDQDWGLFLKTAGTFRVPAGSNYPSESHPAGYYYTWEEGRRLMEYQINYIIDGSGIYENNYGQFRIGPGSLMITFPGEWHRYMPLKATGWTEMYIGFNGSMAQKLMSRPQFTVAQPVIPIGNKEDILDTYLRIMDLVRNEQPGFQQIASGWVVKLLGNIVAFEKQKGFSGKPIKAIIEGACFTMRREVIKNLDMIQFTTKHNISYSYFRRMFKKYTGVSPLQYQMQLKIILARDMLTNSGKSIKEISYDLGFESIHYFSRLFKEKVGVSPSAFAKSHQAGNSRTA
ncbi:MAG: AraC family transcriptional regulator [Bacteroidales bacterium]